MSFAKRLLGTLREREWMARAQCRGADTALFFPTAKGDRTDEAKAMCAVCPVRAECDAWAQRNNEQFGIWAGQGIKGRRDDRKASL